MQISLITGFIPFLLSFAVIILSNVLKFNSEIKNAQKYPLLRSFVQLVIFYITASMENAEILDNECLIALNRFLVLLSTILLYCSFAVQAAAFVILLIKAVKSDDFESITLSSLSKPLSYQFSYQYRSSVSVFRENNSDKRTYLQRLKVIIIPAVTFTFMYFIYGVYET